MKYLSIAANYMRHGKSEQVNRFYKTENPHDNMATDIGPREKVLSFKPSQYISIMTSFDLDPNFVKGLKFLHSKHPDSTAQLKDLVDEVIAQSKQNVHLKDRYTAIKLEDSKLHIKKASRETSDSSVFSSKYASEERDRKAERKQLEKSKQDNSEIEAKIPKLEPPQVCSPSYPSSPPPLDQYVTKKEEESNSSDENQLSGKFMGSSDENLAADEFAMEIGLACVICKSLDVTQGNQLIECQECHNLYHQECHKPPATDDYNDPRRVWYCAKCVKSMKKIATKTQKTAKSGVATSSKESTIQLKSTRSEGSPPAAMLPFKRPELKTTLSQGSSQTANKPIGLAGLAANFGGRTSSSTSSLASSTRGTKAAVSGGGQKSHVPFSSSSTKASSLSGASLSKSASSLASFQSSGASQSSAGAKAAAPAAKGLSLLSVAVASASRGASSAPSGNGNSGHKAPSCSPLMSADKRLQIMKKKASKMQERRRLSNK
ncbi:integrator complex subunit 12 [Caerostris extrusa]|uniref:Integrator complex subunit 12 n=1 Tax=Caerostris extrusa TaxID=172846 RepID=A0AAV4SE19_CAEEX|nr:integrator complex subunit 12 [Caerostris extrusa]